MLFDAYKDGGCNRELSPSFDRKDTHSGYSFENIQLMTCRENKEKGWADMRRGHIITKDKPQRSVLQLTLKGYLVSKHISIAQASRNSKVLRSAISNCLCGLSKSSGGYLWVYN